MARPFNVIMRELTQWLRNVGGGSVVVSKAFSQEDLKVLQGNQRQLASTLAQLGWQIRSFNMGRTGNRNQWGGNETANLSLQRIPQPSKAPGRMAGRRR